MEQDRTPSPMVCCSESEPELGLWQRSVCILAVLALRASVSSIASELWASQESRWLGLGIKRPQRTGKAPTNICRAGLVSVPHLELVCPRAQQWELFSVPGLPGLGANTGPLG